MTPAGIEPATFRFVAQHLNHCATAVIQSCTVYISIYTHSHKHNIYIATNGNIVVFMTMYVYIDIYTLQICNYKCLLCTVSINFSYCDVHSSAGTKVSQFFTVSQKSTSLLTIRLYLPISLSVTFLYLHTSPAYYFKTIIHKIGFTNSQVVI